MGEKKDEMDIHIHEKPDGRYEAMCLQLPGYRTRGRSSAEVETGITELARGYLASLDVPPPRPLCPPVLHESGLGEALVWFGRDMHEHHSMEVAVEIATTERPARDLEVLLFHVVRELLFNVLKHSGVRRARVGLSWADASLRISVSAAGAGFDPALLERREPSVGSFDARERLAAMGGSVQVDIASGQGAQVVVNAPCTPCEA